MLRIACALLLLLAVAPGTARSEAVQLSVGRISPGLDASLPSGAPLYIEVSYRSDQPLRLQARAFLNGESLDKGQSMNASVAHPAGQGRALVWVGFQEPAAPDQIRITAYDNRWTPLSSLTLPSSARWTGAGGQLREQQPAWVLGLIRDEARIAQETRSQEDAEGGWIFDLLIGGGAMLLVPGYFVLQLLALYLLRGGWRIAAAAPLLAMVPLVVHALLALAGGSNLWPLLIILGAPIAFLYLAGLLIVRGVGRAMSAG